MQENELYHYGVRGQKWGVRRYQNPDGSYTQEGLHRYGHSSSSGSSKAAKAAAKAEAKQKRAEEREQKKPIHRLDKLSDDDLKQGIERLQKETQYLNLTNQKYRSLDELQKHEYSLGRKGADATLKKVGSISMRIVEPLLIGMGIAGIHYILDNKTNLNTTAVSDILSRFRKK